ncbi:MAG: ABC transporter ATP-binding protein [Lachnospiraceae bacterium]|nr:ABC transporter ATP-binding protein [Lachnospiraceae bacterium]MDD3660947.1 ABC transporter ATP-binding protein [Lachnospiraceae bacterium]
MAVLEIMENEFQERDFTLPVEQKTEIKIEDLCVEFPDKDGGDPVVALKDVNLEIRQGEFISLVGPSGCGKTTLLRAIADLQKATQGKIEVRGQSPRQIRLQKKYGIVFQSPVLYDWRTVRRNVCMPMELMGMPKKDRTARVSKMLELVGLLEFGKHYPHELSGGMQQRVGIARALAIRPEILLMDEPFSALDEFTKEKLHEDLLRIWRKTNKTVLFVTHNIQEAVFLSDRIVVMSPHPGRVSAVIDVNLERPRGIEIKETPEFTAIVSQVRRSFEGI